MNGNKAAFFDVDGTVVRSNIVWPYVHLRMRELHPLLRVPWVPWFACKAVIYLIVDSFDRALFNRLFYRNYRGRAVSSAAEMARICLESYFTPRLLTGAEARIKELQGQGYRVVLVTGSLDFLIAPLAERLGIRDVIAARLEARDGQFTGALQGAPVSDAEKAVQVREFAERCGIDLAESHAYGDSIADLPMLEAVGHPHAVSPAPRLRRAAQERSWPVLEWR